MKKIIQLNLFQQLKSSWLLIITSSLLFVSCSTQVGGYSETDGVYYDPETDTLPEGVILNDSGNRVGEVYDYTADTSIIENSNQNVAEQEMRYSDWNDIEVADSDWGLYTGAETNYYDNWGWGSPWGWYGYNPYWFGYNPYWYGYGSYWGSGFGIGLSWGWGNPWGWYGFDPFWGYGYAPSWGYWGYGGYYNGFYGNPYYGGYYGNAYRRSGANGRMYNSYQMAQGQLLNSNASAFRKAAVQGRSFRNSNTSSPRSINTVPRTVRDPRVIQNGNPRNNNTFSTPRTTRPRNYSPSRTPDYSPSRNTDFSPSRSGNSGTRSGGFNSGSNGGTRSGSSGGGMRSGGRR